MKSYDSNLRGTTRQMIGIIFIISSFVNVIIDNQDILSNAFILIIGFCLFLWGLFAAKYKST